MATNERKAISKRKRFEVFKRDGFKCQYCGKGAPDVLLEVDHIVPVKAKGDNDMTNLITSCHDCNAGKSDRQLDDNSVIEKQRKQLEELNERREQMKMMLKWRKELDNIDNEKLKYLAQKFEQLAGEEWSLNDSGLLDLKKIIKKYPMDLIIDSMEISTQQYLAVNKNGKGYTVESWNKSFNYIEKICKSKVLFDKDPWLKELHYIRGIMRNRFSIPEGWQVMSLLKQAYQIKISTEEIKDLALQCNSWYSFRRTLEMWIGEAEHES